LTVMLKLVECVKLAVAPVTVTVFMPDGVTDGDITCYAVGH